jgi:hypothetical protein
VSTSVLEAIRMGVWDYEPDAVPPHRYDRTAAMPGTAEKIDVLAERIRNGLPLWHPADGVDDEG